MRRLPPLGALRAFEAAARHLSFKRAGGELGVTPTAISHQVRQLEDAIGLRLFERRTRQVLLTEEGQVLYPVLRDGFDAFAAAVDALSRRRRRAAVTVSATRAFTARWLVSRVAAFQERCPSVDLHILATEDVVDLEAGAADLAIRYGCPPFAGLHAERLGPAPVGPVAHPSLGIAAPDDLLAVPLVHFDYHSSRPDHPTWARWFREAGIAAENTQPSIRFADESHAIQAVIAGQGAGLLNLALVADDLARGALVHPFGPVLQGRPPYLVRPSGRPPSEAVEAVCDWIRMEMAGAERRHAVPDRPFPQQTEALP